ncbi:MAG: hypothetical protein JWM85_2234 [Acidimicrobiaceae bacterium]|nr:hypothetical protein [Acidimicrobiaceae bacterium]
MPRTATTSADRVLHARIAAHTRWAREPDRSAATAAARGTLEARFVAEVDPTGELGRTSPQELAIRVGHARKAHYLRLAQLSAQARRAKAAGQ